MKKATVILAVLVLSATSVLAGDLAFGPRLGYTDSGNLSQIHFGGHAEFRNLTTNLHIIPSVELGTGDGTLLAINGDLVYEFTELASDPWGFYGGGGPVLSYFEKDGFDSTDFALNLVAGVTRTLNSNRHLFGELRVGLEDAPDLKLTVGMTFR